MHYFQHSSSRNGSKLTRYLVGVTLLLAGIGSAYGEGLLIQEQEGWLFPGWESRDRVQPEKIRAALDSIAVVNRCLKANGTALIVLVIPTKALMNEARLPPSLTPSPALRGRYAWLQGEMAARKLHTLDLKTVLQTWESDGDARHITFLRTDYHWTPQAAEVAARVTAGLIASTVVFDNAPRGGAALQEVVLVRSYGDLALRFMTAEQRVALKRDVLRVRAPAKEAQLLLDEDPTEVYVVGNSFVQTYLGFSAMLSHTLNRPVGLHWKPGNFSPWFTLLEYLQSEDFQQIRPKVIVWQLNEPRMFAGPNEAGEWEATTLMKPADWLHKIKQAIGPQPCTD